MKKLKYKLFKIWKAKKYKEYFKNNNYDFDYASLLIFMELKLTMMGLQFAKFGMCEDNKKQVHTIWQARKCLKNYFTADKWAEKICQKKFYEKYNCKYEFEMQVSDLHLKFVNTSKTDLKEESKQFWHSLKVYDLEYYRETEMLKKFSELIVENIRNWWD